MESSATLSYSPVVSFGTNPIGKYPVSSLRYFTKQLQGKLGFKSSVTRKNLNTTLNFRLGIPLNYYNKSSIDNLSLRNTGRLSTICFSYANPAQSADSQNALLKPLQSFSLQSLKSFFLKLTPFDIFKWSLAFSIAIAASKWILNGLFNPFFWTYFSWSWLFWPWMVAIGVAIYGIYCLSKHLRGEANAFEQLAVVTSAFTWLTLVPPAHFNGFLEGWPFVFFFIYHYFFFLNVTVRKRLYGDYYPREHDPKWDIAVPKWQTILFSAGVMVAHWLAAFEGPELHLLPGGWRNAGVWALIMMTIFMQYHSTLYLAKYSEKVVVPTAVVHFGPYRFVRHPIYASTMLLFVTYFAALRAPMSIFFIIAVCLLYYDQKAKLEELTMVETFGEMYNEYRRKVRYKFIPFVY